VEIRKRYEALNKKNYHRYTQALKQDPKRAGMQFDKHKQEFVKARMTQDKFFLRHGSVLSRIEAELNLFTQTMTDKDRSLQDLKAIKRSMLCQNSKSKSESDMLELGKIF
jgi:hypothetical protein